nr:immunoglobulin light chain junction region [Macaca mulatta]
VYYCGSYAGTNTVLF